MSAGSRTVVVNDSDSGITYNGKWGSGSRDVAWDDYDGDAPYGETDGGTQPSLTYSFTGTGIGYCWELDPNQGNIDFYIDGKKAGTASSQCSSSSKQPSKMIWSVSGLTEGQHTFEAVKADDATFMLFDALRVQVPTEISPEVEILDKSPTNQVDLHVFLTGNAEDFLGIANGANALTPGTDSTVSGSLVTIRKAYLAAQLLGTLTLSFRYDGDLNSDVHATSVNGDSFQYAFTGTGIELIGPTGPALGDMDIYLDGSFVKIVSAQSAARQIHQELFRMDGLAPGRHTITGVKKSGDAMLVDQIRYTIDSDAVLPRDRAIAGSGGLNGAVTAELTPDDTDPVLVKNDVVTLANVTVTALASVLNGALGGSDTATLRLSQSTPPRWLLEEISAAVGKANVKPVRCAFPSQNATRTVP